MLKKLFIFSVILFFAGCASLPKTAPLPAGQQDFVRRSFIDMVAAQRQCRRSLDVSVTASFSSLFFSGVVDGYLQAMAPAHIKFVGVSPLGQPLVIFSTDGGGFQFVDVLAARVISGPVTAKLFAKYAPSGLDIDFSYYWLIGRLPPGKVRIMALSRPAKGDGVWLELCCGPQNTRRKILFDPQKKIIKRHILLDEEGKVLLDVSYDKFSAAACPLPGRMVIKSSDHNGRLEIKMGAWNQAADFTDSDFEITPPPAFTRQVLNE